MKSFDETYTDGDFQQRMAEARQSWMSQVPSAAQPDLSVEGLNTSWLSRVLGALTGARK